MAPVVVPAARKLRSLTATAPGSGVNRVVPLTCETCGRTAAAHWREPPARRRRQIHQFVGSLEPRCPAGLRRNEFARTGAYGRRMAAPPCVFSVSGRQQNPRSEAAPRTRAACVGVVHRYESPAHPACRCGDANADGAHSGLATHGLSSSRERVRGRQRVERGERRTVRQMANQRDERQHGTCL